MTDKEATKLKNGVKNGSEHYPPEGVVAFLGS